MKKKKKDIYDKIDYWKKHQELDKFNYNIDTSIYYSIIALLAVIEFSSLSLFGQEVISIKILIAISIMFFLTLIISSIIFWVRIGRHNLSFRIREGMLRVFYQDIGLDTDLLDKQFGEIKKEYTRKKTNKDIENIAKKIINE